MAADELAMVHVVASINDVDGREDGANILVLLAGRQKTSSATRLASDSDMLERKAAVMFSGAGGSAAVT